MYVVQPSLSQKWLAWACLEGGGVSIEFKVRECQQGDERDTVAEPRMSDLVDDDVDEAPVAC